MNLPDPADTKPRESCQQSGCLGNMIRDWDADEEAKNWHATKAATEGQRSGVGMWRPIGGMWRDTTPVT